MTDYKQLCAELIRTYPMAWGPSGKWRNPEQNLALERARAAHPDVPLALLGQLSGLLPAALVERLLALEAALLLVLCLRKFPMAAAADVGDKSVFAFLEEQRRATTA